MLLWILALSSCGIMAYKPDNYDTEYSLSPNECALMLKRPSSSRSTGKSKDDSDKYELQDVETGNCIRYEDINEALRKAKQDLNFVPGYIDQQTISPEELDLIARVIIETTRNLAKRFHLTRKEINYALPTIDTSKTDIWAICPDMYKPTPCTASRFRTFNGQCSNLRNSVMGMARTPFKRFLPPAFSDGVSAPKVSPIDGNPLPDVRKISTKVHTDISKFDERISILFMTWGQFVDHDLTLTEIVRDASGAQVFCCPNITNPPHPNCMPIKISENDPFYSRYNSTCMEFQRTLASIRPRCALGPRIPSNFVTAIIDANFIYGNSDLYARRLRLGSKGLMKTWAKFRDLGLKDILPPMTDTPNKNCIGRTRNKFCFFAGDERANFTPQVAMLHTIYVREHNRIAKVFRFINRHWDDERIYQETRHITAAAFQHIAYNEFLPLLVGPAYMKAYNLTLRKEGYWYGYDEKLPIASDLAFQTIAFRYGHSLVHNKFRLYNKYHKFIDSWETHTVLGQPFNIYQPGTMDLIIGGSVNSPMQTSDRFIVSELTKRLMQPPEFTFGLDIASLDINRGREHALPGYNDFREWCGFPRIETFKELDNYLGNWTALQFSKLYQHPDEIDLFSAGLAEYLVEGGTVGPTFACIIANQMNILRKSDRFWYENPGFPSSFTPGQLQEIRKVTQAKIMCENADDFPTIQMWAMQMPHRVRNPRYYCKDLPQINLEYWIEDPKTKEFKYTK